MKWIDINFRTPELKQSKNPAVLDKESDRVIGLMSDGEVYSVRYCHYKESDEEYFKYFYYTDGGEICDRITHWIPMPEK